jgi:RNA polymerase sigma-70 factor (ECF subfamily)
VSIDGPETAAAGPTAGDRALVEAFLASRDERSFLALYRCHTPALYRIARRLTGSASDAEDAVQDAWLRAVRGLPAFEWRSSLRTWLTGILLNRCRELMRHNGRGAPPLPLDDAVGGELRPEPALDLARAVDGLALGYRTVFVLHDVEGYTHEEIGDVLGVDPGTSKSQLSRARRAIRAALGGHHAR